MPSFDSVKSRVRGDHVVQLRNDVAELREMMLLVNHSVNLLGERIDELHTALEAQQHVLMELNHDVRAGSERALPLFLGYTERLRLDTDTAIGAAQVIERQLALIEDLAGGDTDPS